jgi:vacuolar-type H+-ATPase subunit F/Vma7
VSRLAAIGAEPRIVGYALAGADIHPAADAAAAHAAFAALDGDVACVILTAAAHEALASRLPERPYLLWAVLPDDA